MLRDDDNTVFAEQSTLVSGAETSALALDVAVTTPLSKGPFTIVVVLVPADQQPKLRYAVVKAIYTGITGSAPLTTTTTTTTVQRCEGTDPISGAFSYERKDDPICANAVFALCQNVETNILVQKYCPVLCRLDCDNVAAANAKYLLLKK